MTGTRALNRLLLVGGMTLLLFLAPMCHPRVTVKAKSEPLEVKRDGYTYTQDGEKFYVISMPSAEAKAREELCTKSYVCVYQTIPVVAFKLERHRK